MSDGTRGIDPEELLAHAGWVRALAHGLLFDQQQVDDVVQQTWLLALEQGERRRGPVRAWLGSLVRSQALHASRGEARRTKRERRVAQATPEAGVVPAFDVVAEADLQRRVVGAVLELDEPYRETLLLRYARGLSAEEIARQQGVPGATVRSRLKRGLDRLREQLDAAHDGDRRAWSLALAPLAALGGRAAGEAAASAGMRHIAEGTRGSRGHVGAGGGRHAAGLPSRWTEVLIVGTKGKLAAGAIVALAALAVLWTSAPREPAGVADEPAGTAQDARPVAGEDVPAARLGEVTSLVVPGVTGGAAGKGAGAAEGDAATGTLRVVVTWPDGTPAPGVHVRALDWNAPEPHYGATDGVTDERGAWARARVPVGTTTVYADRGGTATGEVAAGEETELSLEIPEGIALSGTVVDEQGRPVGGASIWLSDYGNSMEGRVVNTAGDDGRFRLRAVGGHHHVGARAAGHTPSPLRVVHPDEAPALDVTLTLGPPGGSVSGTVTDDEGEPIAGAHVLLGPSYGWPQPDPHNGLVWQGPPPFRLRTDEAGRFEVAGVPPGATDLQVRATRWSPWRGRIKVEAGRTVERTVDLAPEVRVSGTVRDADGQPVEGAEVSSGRYGELDWNEARSAADGRYLLRGVGPGSVELTVATRGAGSARASFETSPGDELRWDPVLSRGLRIVGRVRDDSGAPVAGVSVRAEQQPRLGARGGQGISDDEGRFEIADCEAVTYRLLAFPETFGVFTPLAVVPDVRPGGAEVDVVVARDRRAEAWVVGRLLDADGASVPDVMIGLTHVAAQQGPVAKPDNATGAFRLGPVVAGRYVLQARPPESLQQTLGTFDLAADERLDLGEVRLEPPAGLAVRVHPPAGVADDQVSVYLRGTAGQGAVDRLMRGDDGRFTSSPLVQGPYLVTVRGGKYSVEWTEEITLDVGEHEELEVALERAVWWHLGFDMPADDGERPELNVAVLDVAGTEVVAREMKVLEAPGRPRHAGTWFSLRPGTYTVRAFLDGEPALEERVTLVDSGDEELRTDFTLE